MAGDWQDIVFGSAPEVKARPNNVVPITGSHNGASAYGRKALAEECNDLAQCQIGRNHRLNTAAFNLAGLVAAGHLERQEVIDALTAAAHVASGRGDHPLTDLEIANTIESGFRGSDQKVGARTVAERSMPSQVTEVVSADDFDTPKAPPAPRAGTVAAIFDAEEAEFWRSRQSLAYIYEASLARMCAPWAVLAHCAARALCAVRPTATLPPLIGGPGSLNWFGIVVAPSGGGKSAAEDVARELIDLPVEQRSLGSGEGFLESYSRPADKETGEPASQHEAIMFICDESDTLSALNSRTGSTLLSTLRTAWTGRNISFGYRGRTGEKLGAHTYRATLVMAVQPTRAGWILEDAGGGTPQRFNWFPGTDRRISLEAWSDKPISALLLPSWRDWEFNTTIKIPDEARDMVLEARVKSGQGDQNALDGHALFCRLKFAYSLTVLDGRSKMTDEDWRLSGIAARVSTQTREWVAASVASESYVEAEERGRLMGISSAASDDEKAHRTAGRTKRIGGLVLARLEAGPMSDGALRRSLASRDRPWLPNVIQALQAAGLVTLDGDRNWKSTNV